MKSPALRPAVAAAAFLTTGAGPGDGLSSQLEAIAARTGGTVAVSIRHVESGRTVSRSGSIPLPMYSVFKLPLAIAVLQEIEAGRLSLDRKVQVTPADIVPGSAANTARWRRPVETTVGGLIDVSMVESDNTSADKLLELLGGPSAVERAMSRLGFPEIRVKSSVRGFSGRKGPHPNDATADDLARLLADLRRGALLKPAQRDFLLDTMARATTGRQRLRGDLPAGALVGDKTGSGPATTNDVGLITLPAGRGHLAIAVLVDGSKKPLPHQEKAIAEIARAAWDAEWPAVASTE